MRALIEAIGAMEAMRQYLKEEGGNNITEEFVKVFEKFVEDTGKKMGMPSDHWASLALSLSARLYARMALQSNLTLQETTQLASASYKTERKFTSQDN